MRILLRVAAALLVAAPLLVVLVVVFALAGRRRTSPPLESGTSRSFERAFSAGPSNGATQAPVGVSH